MTVYKYYSNSPDYSYLQASIKPVMGKVYSYNGRAYCHINQQQHISYADLNFNFEIKLQNWNKDNQDIEIEIKNISLTEEYNSTENNCNIILNPIYSVQKTPFYIRVSNTGNILRVFNALELINKLEQVSCEQHIIDLIEFNPILSAIVKGFIEKGKDLFIPFQSYLLPPLNGRFQLDLKSEDLKIKKAKKISMTNRAILFDKEKQTQLARSLYNILGNTERYNANISITVNKGIDKVVPYSIMYTIEEKLQNGYDSFISIGIEKLVPNKGIAITTKLSSRIYQRMCSIFDICEN